MHHSSDSGSRLVLQLESQKTDQTGTFKMTFSVIKQVKYYEMVDPFLRKINIKRLREGFTLRI
jgi:hypothetical protein